MFKHCAGVVDTLTSVNESLLSFDSLLKKNQVRNSLTFSFLILLISTFTLLSPNWFTTNTNTIDPWIYWGAGDNPKLSYSNGFADTYYLQRYVIIGPQIVVQFLFGPYWSQLVLALFWLSLTLYALWLLVKNHFIFLSAASILIIDRTVMGMFGVSYSQAASLALLLLSLATFAAGLDNYQKSPQKNWKTNLLFLLSGVLAGGLANAYLAIASIYIPAVTLSLILIDFYGRAHIRATFIKLLTFLLGATLSSIMFQAIFILVSKSRGILLLKQINFGRSLLQNKNPWGGDNGFTGFLLKVSNNLLFHWWLGVLIFLFACALILFYRKTIYVNIKTLLLIIYSLLSTALFLLSHFTYSWFLGYSWTALMLIIPQITGLLLFLSIYKISKRTFKFFVLATYVTVGLKLSFNALIMSGNQLQILRKLALLLILVFLIGIILQRIRKISQRRISKIFNTTCFNLLILCLIALRSSYLAFAGDLTGAGSNAKDIYTEVSNQRNALSSLVKQTGGQYRIWLTPENSLPLTSSMLYSYSLISPSVGEPSCNQVEWASSNAAIVATFVVKEEIVDIERNYLKPCGFRLERSSTKPTLHSATSIDNLKFGILKKVN